MKNRDKISPSLDYLMGPDFAGYLKDRNSHRDMLKKLPFEQLFIKADDGTPLTGYFYQNPDKTGLTAVLVHGHSSNGFQGYGAVGLKYIHHGYNILLVDNRACGNSGGEWCTFGIKEREDTMKWVKYLLARRPSDQVVLHGTSLGGATVCMMSDMDLPEQVKAIVSDCAFANIRRQLECMMPVYVHVPYWLVLPQTLCWFRHATGLSIDACSPLESVKHAKVPMLFIHGTEDHYVKPENAKLLYDACTSEKELLMIEGAGHAAAHYIGKEKYEDALFQFLDAHLRGNASCRKS